MLSHTLRRDFLQYFNSKEHTIVPSSPVVPQEDATLLFANAGMNQFKDVFLGSSKRDYTKAATSQKCIRVGGKHNDLDNVGHTSRHLTFFEMLGNFSFGDYFKKEAVAYAWDVTTNIFTFDPERIWVSVYKDDDEAFELWTKHLSPKRIVRFGEKENFWAMGETGPCGPCSELLYDRGETFGKAKNPHDDLTGERYFEFWNLVFMQYMRDGAGSMTPLPKQSIDTGAGLERVVSLRMGVENVFLTDVLRSLIARVEEMSHTKYDPLHPNPAFHVIADHIRSLSFAIADGAIPSNVDRGYVLRKILRRAVRYGRTLHLQRPFLADLLPRLVETMGEDYPELKKSSSHIAEILTIEEENFLRTLQRGGNLLAQSIETSRSRGVISGEDAFKLKDTYGFPLEEIVLIAKDEHLQVDLPRFGQLEEEAKEKSRKSRKVAAQKFEGNFFRDFTHAYPPCQFVGYSQMSTNSCITGIVIGEKFVDELVEGDEGFLILEATPFYAEMGGQVGDTGHISSGNALFQVEDCLSPYPGVIAHLGRVVRGGLKKGEHVKASVDEVRRLEIENNHTATHLLHWALQKVLGSHIKQAGSLVDEKRLRFDFSHHKALTLEELREIERLVNEKIRENRPVHTYELSFDEAQKRSDIKQFFGEKYGSKVRVIDIDFSKELCGGTHTQRTGAIGYFKIAKEGSIAAGSRRLEAVTGKRAEDLIFSTEDLLQKIAGLVKAPLGGVVEKLEELLEENKELSQEIKTVRAHQLKELAAKMLLAHKEQVGEIALIAQEVALTAEELAPFAEELMRELKSGVIVLGAKGLGRCQLLVQVSPDLVQRQILATSLVKEAAPLIQGGGGGREMLAQAGGKDPLGLPHAFAKIKELLKQCS